MACPPSAQRKTKDRKADDSPRTSPRAIAATEKKLYGRLGLAVDGNQEAKAGGMVGGGAVVSGVSAPLTAAACDDGVGLGAGGRIARTGRRTQRAVAGG